MNFNPLIPELSVSHFEQSLSFYTEVLPFRVEFQRPEHRFAFLSCQGCQLMIAQENLVWKAGTLEVLTPVCAFLTTVAACSRCNDPAQRFNQEIVDRPLSMLGAEYQIYHILILETRSQETRGKM